MIISDDEIKEFLEAADEAAAKTVDEAVDMCSFTQDQIVAEAYLKKSGWRNIEFSPDGTLVRSFVRGDRIPSVWRLQPLLAQYRGDAEAIHEGINANCKLVWPKKK